MVAEQIQPDGGLAGSLDDEPTPPPGGGTRRRRIGLVLAPALFVLCWFTPLPLFEAGPSALWPDVQQRLLAVFVAVVVLWVSEAMAIAGTALLIAPLLVLTGVCDASSAFTPYADPLLFLFTGGFMLAKAMTRHKLDRRIALFILSHPAIGAVPWRVRVGFALAGLLLSMWISNVATTAILLPILLGMEPLEHNSKSRQAVRGSLLAVAYGNSIGGLGTPVGSPPNAIAVRFLQRAGVDFGFFDWMIIALPVAVVMTAIMLVLFLRMFPPTQYVGGGVAAPKRPFGYGEKVTLMAFLFAVVGWVTPGVLRLGASVAAAPELRDTLNHAASSVSTALPGGAVAMIAACSLLLVRDRDNVPVLPWREANRIDWGIIMLFGGGISLGNQMFATGLAETLSLAFVEMTGVQDLWLFTAIVTVFTIVFTETTSNTATSNMLCPLVIAISSTLGVSPVPPVLAVGLAASCAFMLPIATGPNAMVYGTGQIRQGDMMRAGIWLNLTAALVIFIWLRITAPIFGWS